MTHILIVGQTESGKTTLATKLVNQVKAKTGRPLLVLDPHFDPRWDADYMIDYPDVFLDYVKANTGCELVIDESGQTIGRYAKEMAYLATASRHRGHRATFIAQRAQQLDRTVRDQCSTFYIFSVAKADAKLFAEDFVDDTFLECPNLGKGECIVKTRFQPARKIKIF